jgi:hypothetical protein
MRSYTSFFLILISCIVVQCCLASPAHTTGIPEGTTYYRISGEMCYDYFTNTFVGSYTVEGQMRVGLDWLNPSRVDYELWHFLTNPEGEAVLVNETDSGTFIDRMKEDGNYTPFFADLPCPSRMGLHTLTESVEAQYLGERYVLVDGKYIRTHCYCYTQAELYSIYRCEWYFEWDSGVLLRLFKSIEVNLLPVQWIEYSLENTTVSLTTTHPVTAFFTNQQATFFGILGAAIAVVLSFYLIIQRKVRRGEIA